MYRTKTSPRHMRIEGEDFQSSIRTKRASTWFTGENSLKKLAGLTVLKYSLVVAMELGISLLHDFASTNEV